MLRVAEEAYRTDTGRQRQANEDALFARRPLFAVADGMGGAQAGEVASRIATEALEESTADESPESPEPFLKRIAETANKRIHKLSQTDSTRSGMGTTLTAALISDDEISIAHVGDSRAYLYRDGELRRLTSDHSLVEELRRQGRLTEEQAEEHPQRSIITRALGPEPEVEVDTMTYKLQPADVILLCSDGLTTMIHEAEIAEIMSRSPSLEHTVEALIEVANERGGRDNITVVAFRLEQAGAPPDDSQATLVGPAAEAAGLTADRVAAAQREQAVAVPSRHAKEPRRWPGRVLTGLVAILIVAGLAAAAWYGSRQVHFLGVDEGGRVALYEGLPYDLPFGIELYDEVASSAAQLSSLPADRRDEATNHEWRSEDDAQSLIEDLENDASAPPTQPPTAPPTGDDEPPGAGGGGSGAKRNGGSGGQGDSRGSSQPQGGGGAKQDSG